MTGEKTNLSAVLERGRLAKRLAYAAIILSAALSLTVFLAGPVYQWSGMELFSLGLLPFVLSMIFAVCAAVYSAFFCKMISEEEEKVLLERRKANVTSLLDISEDVRFTAKRTLSNYVKYIPPAIAFFCFLLCGTAIVVFWTRSLLGAADTAALGSNIPKNPINLAFLSAMAAAFSFIGGIFFVGQSHVREYRFLRPVGSWLILGSAVMLLSAVCALLINGGKTGYDLIVEKFVFLIYALLTLEFLISFVVEFYRPRTQEEQRPVYESRLLAIFTEPGGVMRNIAESLDYQFGFKVSRTWIYTFFQRHLVPALILWGFAFWLFTGIAEVAPGEVGIRERFGAFPGNGTEVLQPGVHLKLPWPFERIVRVPTEIVQTVTIGSQVDTTKNPAAAKIILWTGQHYLKEDTFLVATQVPGETNDRKGDSSMLPVSILEVSMPLHYKAKQGAPYRYAFQFRDVAAALTSIGQAEATQYFASTDFMEDLSYGRTKVMSNLGARIQDECDRLEMGVEILSVGMHDAHPPVGKMTEEGKQDESPDAMPNVAEAFQDVVCAREEAISLQEEARETAVRTVETAKVDALNIVTDAEAYRFNTTEIAKTDAFRFKSQLGSYLAQPEMFQLRAYLDFLENDCADLRKYIVSSKLPVRNYILNLESKPSLDLLDTDISSFGK